MLVLPRTMMTFMLLHNSHGSSEYASIFKIVELNKIKNAYIGVFYD